MRGLASGLFFNVQSSFGVGRHYSNGGRFFFDIIGLGMGLAYESAGLASMEADAVGFVEATGVGGLLNFLSFHHTTKSGFYFSWRNNFTLFTHFTEKYTNNSGDSIMLKGRGAVLEYKTYFTFGFDISKKYNPSIIMKKNYEKRAS